MTSLYSEGVCTCDPADAPTIRYLLLPHKRDILALNASRAVFNAASLAAFLIAAMFSGVCTDNEESAPRRAMITSLSAAAVVATKASVRLLASISALVTTACAITHEVPAKSFAAGLQVPTAVCVELSSQQLPLWLLLRVTQK